MVKISVIIPSFNYGAFIGDAIRSAEQQSRPPDEIIVVDDGSTDDTADVVAGFGDRVKYIKQENSGVCSARNRGVAESRGDLIAFLDADDVWEPTKLEKQAARFYEDVRIGLVHCGMREFDSATGETISEHIDGLEGDVANELLVWERPVIVGAGGTIMVSREAFEKVGGFDTSLKCGEDWEFCYRIARKYWVGFVPEILVNYRSHKTNSHKNINEMERSTLLAWGKVFDGSDSEIVKLKRRSYSNLHRTLAGSYFHAGQYAGCLRNIFKSLWYRPSLLGYYLAKLFRSFSGKLF